MGSTPNKAEFYDGIPKAQPTYLVDINGNPLTGNSGLPIVLGGSKGGVPTALTLDGNNNLNVDIQAINHGNVVDATNSSITALGSNSIFTGAWQSSLNYSAISVEVFADQVSVAGGLSIQQSQDGVNADTQDNFSISASTAFNTTVNLIGKFYRIKYTNGATGQGTFRLQTITQAAESVLPRILSALGNLKISIADIAGIATQMATGDGLTGTNMSINEVGLSNGGTGADRWRASNGMGDASTVGIGSVGPMTFNGGNWDRQRGNLDNLTLINATGVTTTQTSVDQINYNARGVKIFFNMATVGTGSVTITIQGKDPVSGQYYTILAGVAVTTNVFTVYSIYPGLTAAANSVANDMLPRTWRVLATANNANATTYTVAYSLIL